MRCEGDGKTSSSRVADVKGSAQAIAIACGAQSWPLETGLLRPFDDSNRDVEWVYHFRNQPWLHRAF